MFPEVLFGDKTDPGVPPSALKQKTTKQLLCFERSTPIGAPTVWDIGCHLNLGAPHHFLLHPTPSRITAAACRLPDRWIGGVGGMSCEGFVEWSGYAG